MSHSTLLLLCGLGLTIACSPANETTSTDGGATKTSVVAPEVEEIGDSMPKNAADELEAHALACNGTSFATMYASLDQPTIDGLVGSKTQPSARLMVLWERGRQFDEDGKVVKQSVEAFAASLESELGQSAPSWWLAQLASATRIDEEKDGPSSYDVGLIDSGDRRGEWQDGPKGTRVRPDAALVLVENGDQLAYDLSMGRVDLGTMPTAGQLIEVGRAHAGSTLYWATFEQSRGGFRFPLRAVGSKGEVWSAEVCGPDRATLGGMGHSTVEIVVLQPPPPPGKERKMGSAGTPTGVAVFSAESHGVALDVFDPSTGARTLAWSSELWFDR